MDLDQVQKRFVRFDYVEERKLTGTVITYGDIGKLYDGYRERFESGAFGDVSKLDVVLNMQHDHRTPLCRTRGGGLTLIDDPDAMRLNAELPDTQAGRDAMELVRTKVLRGFSIEFMPKEYREEKDSSGTITIIEKADLVGIGLVDKPVYKASKVTSRGQQAMDNEKLSEMIDAKLESVLAKIEAGDGAKIDVEMIRTSVVEAVSDEVESHVKDQVDSALAARDEAKEAAEKAEREREESEKLAAEERANIIKEAEQRAELIVNVRSLLPQDFDTADKSMKEILVAAVGEEVEDAEGRSEDYLQAKVEGILERREVPPIDPQPTGSNPNRTPVGVDMNQLVSQRRLDLSARHISS